MSSMQKAGGRWLYGKSLGLRHLFAGIFIVFLLLILRNDAKEYSDTASTIVINEVMTSNGRTIRDLEDDYEDWIELNNPGKQNISLDSCALTDDKNQLGKWKFQDTTIQAGEYLIIFASGKDLERHCSFKLKSKGGF